MKDAEKVLKDAKAKTSTVIDSGKKTLDEETGKLKSAFKAGVDAYKESKSS